MSAINLFWCKTNNFGDELGPYIVSKLSGKKVRYTDPRRFDLFRLFRKTEAAKTLLSVGSIIDCSNSDCIVWGSGIMDRSEVVHGGDIRLVRGPKTRARLIELGLECPLAFGDPALVLPILHSRPITTSSHKMGIIPHKLDEVAAFSQFPSRPEFIKISLTDSIDEVLARLFQCEFVLSSSLHGLIVAHAYGIPALWVKFGAIGGDDIKFQDYFLSVQIPLYRPFSPHEFCSIEQVYAIFDSHKDKSQILSATLKGVQETILETAPFSIVCGKNEAKSDWESE